MNASVTNIKEGNNYFLQVLIFSFWHLITVRQYEHLKDRVILALYSTQSYG